MELITDAKNEHQTEEAEMIVAGMKIGEKVFADGKPTKFPVPEGTIHIIFTDMRGYLAMGGDHLDYKHIALGAEAGKMWTHYWNGKPIKGLFEKSNEQLKAAKFIRERIHFIGFIREKDYKQGEIRDNAFYALNKHLFKNTDELNKVWETYPLKSRTKEAY